jgi:hypothetical protein
MAAHTIKHIVCLWRYSPQWVRASSFTRFLDHTKRRTRIGRAPLDEWSARCRDLYLTTHNTHNRQTSMTPVGFEPTISAGEWQQIYALDRAVTGTGTIRHIIIQIINKEINLVILTKKNPRKVNVIINKKEWAFTTVVINSNLLLTLARKYTVRCDWWRFIFIHHTSLRTQYTA